MAKHSPRRRHLQPLFLHALLSGVLRFPFAFLLLAFCVLLSESHVSAAMHDAHGAHAWLDASAHVEFTPSRRWILGTEGELQQDGNVTAVTTPQALQEAVDEAAEHIEIRAHLDLTVLEMADSSDILGKINKKIKSIRGNCPAATTPPPNPTALGLSSYTVALRPLKPYQCLLLVNAPLLRIKQSQLWLQGLYVRLSKPRDGPFKQFVEVVGRDSQLWITDVTMQGNGDGESDCKDCALLVDSSASVFVSGSQFLDFDGAGVVGVHDGARASFVGSLFAGNNLIDDFSGPAVIEADADEYSDAPTKVRLERCTFSQNVPATTPNLLADNRGAESNPAVYYTDTASAQQLCVYEGADEDTPPNNCTTIPPTPLSGAGEKFLTFQDPWIVATRSEVPERATSGPNPTQIPVDTHMTPNATESPEMATGEPPANPADAPVDTLSSERAAASSITDPDALVAEGSGESSGRLSGGAIAGGVVAVVVGLLLIVALVLLFIKRRQSDMSKSVIQVKPWVSGSNDFLNAPPTTNSPPTPASPSSAAATAATAAVTPPNPPYSIPHARSAGSTDYSTLWSTAAVVVRTSKEPRMHGDGDGTVGSLPRPARGGVPASALGATSDPGTVALTCWSPRRTPADLALLGKDDAAALMKFMNDQLDTFGPEHLLLGRYQLLGPNERRAGGQSVVQFARRTDGTGMAPYAIKFFARCADYKEEAAMYCRAPLPLRRFMPNVVKFVDNEGGSLKDPFGTPLHPFIVMEKGECLQDRARNWPVDVFTAAQVLGHVSERIAELHDAGYVHRDLKPGNIMWQPRTYNWVLIDFGISSPLHELAPCAFTPTYAAPETIRAHQNGVRQVTADAAVDAWALGVIAFELLVDRPAFFGEHQRSEVYKQLTDPAHPLPWEPARISPADKAKLGRFHKPIMKLLHRDPCMRATARQFCDDVRNVFTKKVSSRNSAPGTSAMPHADESSSRNQAANCGVSGTENYTSSGSLAVSTRGASQKVSTGDLTQRVSTGGISQNVSTGGGMMSTGGHSNKPSSTDTDQNLMAAAMEASIVRMTEVNRPDKSTSSGNTVSGPFSGFGVRVLPDGTKETR